MKYHTEKITNGEIAPPFMTNNLSYAIAKTTINLVRPVEPKSDSVK